MRKVMKTLYLNKAIRNYTRRQSNYQLSSSDNSETKHQDKDWKEISQLKEKIKIHCIVTITFEPIQRTYRLIRKLNILNKKIKLGWKEIFLQAPISQRLIRKMRLFNKNLIKNKKKKKKPTKFNKYQMN